MRMRIRSSEGFKRGVLEVLYVTNCLKGNYLMGDPSLQLEVCSHSGKDGLDQERATVRTTELHFNFLSH